MQPSSLAATPRPVSIIVLTWNGLAYTQACLASIARVTDLSAVEVVVVDNGSTDGTVEYLRGIPWIRVIAHAENLGFVRGNNEALKGIGGERDVILLNNDTEIDDPSWIAKLQASAYRADTIGIIGCRIRRLGQSLLQHAGTYMPDLTYWGQQIGGGERDIGQFGRDRDVEGVVFACVYIKRAVLDAIGALDEDYFSYFEDSDYCFKARAAGFRIINCGALTISHREHGSTAANKANFNEMFQASQKTFVRKWDKVLAERYVLDVVWNSTFFRPIGYAMPSRVLAIALDEAGVRVAYQYLYGAGTVFPVDESKGVSSGNYRLEIIRRRTPRPDAPRIMFGQADAFSYVTEGYRIGYSMLETTGIPADWVQGCNEVDEVWVPTPFNAWTFRRSGVTKPVRVMPLGLIDTNYFNPDIVGHPIEGVFTFLSIFEWGERKAPEVLLRAFNKAFRRDEPVVLICKFVNSDPAVDPRAAIAALDLDPDGGRLLISENERVPYYQLPQFYRSADCFVLPTRGEGWGMPILEAMACGLPVIASHWSAQLHYMNDANSYPLQVGLVPAEAKCPYYTGFQWADPDEVHLAERMRHVYEHRDEARAKGVRAAQDVEALWSVDITARRIRSRLVEIAGRGESDASEVVARPVGSVGVAAARKRIGIDVARAVGREVTGIGRYAVGLLRGLARLPDVECPFDFLLMPGFHRFVHPEYMRGVSWSPPDDQRFTVYRGPLPAFADGDRYVPGLDLVHCTGNSRPGALDVPSTFVVYDTTFITHAHYHTDENVRFCMRSYEEAVASDCHFIAISESTRRDLLKHFGVAEDRVSVAYCAVDPLEFAPQSADAIGIVRRKYGLPLRYFLCVGSLEPRKNVESAIRAIESYEGRESLVIVGASGWHNSRLHELIGRAHQRVLVLGYVDPGDLPAIYCGAVATVYPSHYEGFGLPVVESMACGTPVITSNNSSLAEIGEVAAILLEDPADWVALCRQFEAVAGDAVLADALRRGGLERAARFTPERCARATLEIFDKLLSKVE